MSKKNQVKISTKKHIEYDILCKSLIGKNIKIVDSKNKTQIGLIGVLEYESTNMFYLKIEDNIRNKDMSGNFEQSSNKIKKILKNSVVIEFELDNKKFQVNGGALLGNILTRIKKIK